MVYRARSYGGSGRSYRQPRRYAPRSRQAHPYQFRLVSLADRLWEITGWDRETGKAELSGPYDAPWNKRQRWEVPIHEVTGRKFAIDELERAGEAWLAVNNLKRKRIDGGGYSRRGPEYVLKAIDPELPIPELPGKRLEDSQ